MLIDDPWFYLAAVPAVIIVGISKSGLGGGLGLVSVPLLALTISPVQAAAIVLPVLCVMDLMSGWAYRRTWDRRNLLILIPSGVVGLAIGALSFRYLSEDAVRLIIGSVAVLFTLDRWLGLRPRRPPGRGGVAAGTLWGALSGFTSFVAHAGGPPVQVYLLPQRLDKTVFVGTTVVFFLAVNYAKLLPYGLLGLLSSSNLATSLAILPLAPLGIWLGLRLHRLMPEALFYRLVYLTILISGIKLIWDGLHLGARLGL